MDQTNNLVVCRTDHNKNYKIIDTTCIEDKRLSWKAKAIHNYLVTRPEDWEINTKDLEGRSIDGVSSLRAGIDELIEFAYLFRIIKRNNKKQIEKWGYFSTELPQSKEYVEELIKESGWIIYIPSQFKSEQEGVGDNLKIGFSKNRKSDSIIISNSNNKESFNKINKDKSLLATSLPDNVSSPIKEIKPLSDEEQLFDYWNMIANENKNEKTPLNKFQPIPNHLKFRNGKPTNIYTRALHLIEVRLKRFSKEEIAQAFNLYAEIFYNPDIYKLKSKFKTDRMNIDDFFEIEKLDRASMKSYALSKNIESWFDEMIKGRDYLLKTYSCQPSPNQKQIQSIR
jgi:hypothetical protein